MLIKQIAFLRRRSKYFASINRFLCHRIIAKRGLLSLQDELLKNKEAEIMCALWALQQILTCCQSPSAGLGTSVPAARSGGSGWLPAADPRVMQRADPLASASMMWKGHLASTALCGTGYQTALELLPLSSPVPLTFLLSTPRKHPRYTTSMQIPTYSVHPCFL